jgi:hypothetical protein
MIRRQRRGPRREIAEHQEGLRLGLAAFRAMVPRRNAGLSDPEMLPTSFTCYRKASARPRRVSGRKSLRGRLERAPDLDPRRQGAVNGAVVRDLDKSGSLDNHSNARGDAREMINQLNRATVLRIALKRPRLHLPAPRLLKFPVRRLSPSALISSMAGPGTIIRTHFPLFRRAVVPSRGAGLQTTCDRSTPR